jgi:hypothetical protein
VTLGIVANLIRVNRSLLEDTLEVLKRQQFMGEGAHAPSTHFLREHEASADARSTSGLV